MNPLPNRPLLTNTTLPLTLPNVPNFDQMAYNGRPRKIVPEVGKDFPVMNGVAMVNTTSAIPAIGGQPVPLVDREPRMTNGPSMSSNLNGSQPQLSGQQAPFPQQQVSLQQAQSMQVQMQQQEKEMKNMTEPQQLTSIFRPDDDWKEQLARARAEKSSQQQQQQQPSGASAWDVGVKDEDDDSKEENIIDDEETSSTSEEDGKIWRTRRTLRKSAYSEYVTISNSLT